MIMNARFPSLVLIAGLVAVIAFAPGAGYAQTGTTAGQLAIAGTDGNIHLYDLAGDSFTQLTADGNGVTRIYSWPTWSNDGRLAYFGINTGQAPFYTLGIFIDRLNGSDPTMVYSARDEVFTYAAWSPADCPAGNCRDLAVLYTAGNGQLAARTVRMLDSTFFGITELATGGPFYWDWSPDGASIFWAHYNSELSVYDIASGAVVETFEEIPGYQRAVDWSPVDDRLLATDVTDLRESSLLIFDGAERITLAEDLRGVVSFEWSPDGAQVAYADGDRGRLYVVDAQAGAESVLISDDVVGFFWSPDGTKIAYITLTRDGGDVLTLASTRAPGSAPRAQATPDIRWHVYDVATGQAQRLANFLPSRDMIYYLQFYDQFARSHRLWSPDSRYIVYGETLLDGERRVMLLDTDSPGTPPEPLMDGRIGVFSW